MLKNIICCALEFLRLFIKIHNKLRVLKNAKTIMFESLEIVIKWTKKGSGGII